MSLSRILDAFSAFIDLVAQTLVAALASLRRGQAVRIEETPDGRFRLAEPSATPTASFQLDDAAALPALAPALRGREVELVLDPDRFLLQPLELPKAATGFLAGIVRAQIDRLTPWSAAEAAYGWTTPTAQGDERISLTVAATPRARIIPLTDRLKALGARAVIVATRVEGAGVTVLDEAAAGPGQTVRLRQVLLAVLGAAALGATFAVAAGDYLGSGLDAELEDLNTRIAAQRSSLLAARDGTGTQTAALRALEQMKRQQPSTLLVIEALSDTLPNHTYLTQLEVDDGKVSLSGISREASALIALLERSRRFSQATFAAPTIRSEGDDGESFQIDARIVLPMEFPR